MSRRSTHDLGRAFEDAACTWLQTQGWAIVARNERRDRREIDIIAALDDVVAFVEVKGRRSRRAGHPLEAVTYRKRREIEYVARRWVHEHRSELRSVELRFDVIGICWTASGEWTVDHVAHAWSQGE